jgi:hypothetical protein
MRRPLSCAYAILCLHINLGEAVAAAPHNRARVAQKANHNDDNITAKLECQ